MCAVGLPAFYATSLMVNRMGKVTVQLGRTLPSQERRRSQRQERRSWAFADCCRAGRRQVVQHVAALLAYRSHGGEAALDELTARRTLGAKTPSPPQHCSS